MVDVEYIRKLHHVKGLSGREIALKLGHARNTVSKYLKAQDHTPKYHLEAPRPAPVLGPFRAIIERWVAEDDRAPVKQRHTAKRIYDRLRAKYGFSGAESTVREYVHWIRASQPKAFVPLAYELGQTGQSDWGEAEIEQDGRRVRVPFFCLRLCASGISFVQVFPHQKVEAIYEGHRRAFEFFGGVPHEIWYDNPKTLVKEVGPGRSRVEQDGFIALKTHYLFDATYCTAGKEGAHEKGLVENLVGYTRRNFFVPVPKVSSLQELNELLLQRCLEEANRRIGHREETAGALWEKEKEHLLPLPAVPFSCSRTISLKVNSLSLVQFERCRYSVPTELAGRIVTLRAFVDRIEIAYQDRLVAKHPRLYTPFSESLQVEHYLSLLAQRPSAVANARVFARLPEVYQEFRRRCLAETPSKARDFVAVLRFHAEFGQAVVGKALEQALDAGVCTADAVRQFCLRQLPGHEAPPPLAKGGLPALNLGAPDLGRYNRLLGEEVTA